MNDNIQSNKLAESLKAIRFTLVELENALNTVDPILVRSLFAESAVLMTTKGRIPVFSQGNKSLSVLLFESDNAPSYCTLAVDEVFLLSPLTAYAEIMLHLHVVNDGDLVETTRHYIVILGRDMPSGGWHLLLVYYLSHDQL